MRDPLSFQQQNLKKKMSTNDSFKCNQCLKSFSKENNPYRMPVCDHNICCDCITQLQKSQENVICCAFCQRSLFNFTNITLKPNKTLMRAILNNSGQFKKKEKVTCDILDLSNLQNDHDEALLTQREQPHLISNKVIEQSQKTSVERQKLCKKHGNPIEIICVTDLSVLCSMCALFDGHKDHQLVKKEEFQDNIQSNFAAISSLKQKKYIVENKKLSEEKNSESIQIMLNQKKFSLLGDLKIQIQQMIQQIRQAEEKIIQEIEQQLKRIKTEIASLFQMNSEPHKKLNQLQEMIAQFENTVEEGQNCKSLRDLVKIYKGNGKLVGIEKGHQILQNIEKNYNSKMKKLESSLSALKIQMMPDQNDLTQNIYFYKQQKKSAPNHSNHNTPNQSFILKKPKPMNTSEFQQNSFLCDFSQDEIECLSELTKSIDLTSPEIQKKLKVEKNKDGKKQVLTSTVVLSKKQQNNPRKRVMASPNRQIKFASPNRFSKLQPTKTQQNSLLTCRSNHKYTKSAADTLLKSRSMDKNQMKNLYNSPKSKIEERQRNPQESISEFLRMGSTNKKQQILDLSSFNLTDQEIFEKLSGIFVKINSDKQTHKKIKMLKLNENQLSNQGFFKIIPYLGSCTNLNLSANRLSDDILGMIIESRDELAPLRLVNLSKNDIIEKKVKLKLETLKKMGILIQI